MEQTKGSILVVDDERDVRTIAALILEQAGFRVDQADGGQEAIGYLNGTRPDLILLDIMMPGVNGWDVLAHIRELSRPPRVVLVSGMRDVILPADTNRYVSGYLVKPFVPAELCRACEAAIGWPPLVSAKGDRKEARRTFVIETTLVSEAGVPMTRGQLIDVSLHGFKLNLSMRVKPGDPVRVALRLPGQPDPLLLRGQVRWQDEAALGAEVGDLSEDQRKLLQEFLQDS